MEIWALWLAVLRDTLGLLSTEAGLSLGLAVIAATILLRTVLLPISWTTAYRACVRQKKMLKLQPELEKLKAQYADKPDVYMQRMMELYRKHDISIVDGKSLMGALAQAPLFLGMYQVLRDTGEGIRFLWVQSLARPDAVLALLAGATTALMMAVNPDLPEQMRTFMILVPSILALVFALKLCSALAIYWTASNCFSAAQTLVLHRVVARRIRSGALTI
jgi:YidC/Oxa1 family membrane protein insertase